MTGEGAGRVVVGVDGSDHGARALRWAIDEARRRGASLQMVHAWQYPYIGVDIGGFTARLSVLEAAEKAARQILDDAATSASNAGVDDVERSLVSGPAAGALLDAAKGAELLVVGSRGRGGFAGLLLGSISQQVAHHAPCPVVIVPGGDGEDD